MTPHEKNMRIMKELLRKAKKRRVIMRLEELAAKREEVKRGKDERDFRRFLRKDSSSIRQLLNRSISKISRLERKIDRIIKKNKLKS